MEASLARPGSTKLYALRLKLRPLQYGTLMAFSGELVHGAFMRWLGNAAPDIVAWLHEGNKRRLFTCSSLEYPLSEPRMRDCERRNVHLPLEPEHTYTIRLTLLLGELFPLFHDALVHFSQQHTSSASSPFIQLGKQLFLLEEILITPGDPSQWTGFTSLSGLVDQARGTTYERNATITLEFASLTTFNRGNSKTGYGSYPVLFPQPEFVVQNLLRRWEDIVPPELANLVQRERIEEYMQQEGMIVVDYNIRPHHVHFTTHEQRGFLGTCTYQLRGSDEKTTSEAPLTVRQQITLLAHLAFYSGIGYKTAMGLGRARLVS